MYYGNKTYLKNTTDGYGNPYFTTNIDEAAEFKIQFGAYEWLRATNLVGAHSSRINVRFSSSSGQIRFDGYNQPQNAEDGNKGVTFSEIENNGYLFKLGNPSNNTSWYLENDLD